MRAVRQQGTNLTQKLRRCGGSGEVELLRLRQCQRGFGWLASKRCLFQNKTHSNFPSSLSLSSPSSSLLTRHWIRSVNTVNVPNMGDSVSEGTLVEWAKKVGDYCKVDDIVAVIETDKVSIDVRTDQAGVLTEQLAAVDDTLEVGAPLFKLDPSAKAPEKAGGGGGGDDKGKAAAAAAPSGDDKKKSPAPEKSSAAPPPPPPPPSSGQKKATESPPPKPEKSSKPSAPPSQPSFKSREERRVPMSRMRQRIAQRLKESQERAASLTTFNEIDMSALIAMRAKHKDIFLEKHGVKLGFMSAFVKASVSALREQPSINAFIDDERKETVFHDYCDVSVAVASPNGLVVPVIRNAESMSFADVEKQIQEYANKAKKGTLSLEEMTGGTFTISNGGVFGSLMGTPILNPPQSAILGMHGVFDRPIAVNGNVEIRPMMYVALTYDHRIVDGREAVLFLRRVKDTIEDPHRLLLDC